MAVTIDNYNNFYTKSNVFKVTNKLRSEYKSTCTRLFCTMRHSNNN